MTDIRPQLRAMPSSLNDACRTMEVAADQIDALVKALEQIEYASRKDSLTEHERLQSVRTVVCAALSRFNRPFYGAECPSYPNCAGGCGCGCTKEVERAKAHKATEQPHD